MHDDIQLEHVAQQKATKATREGTKATAAELSRHRRQDVVVVRRVEELRIPEPPSLARYQVLLALEAKEALRQ